MKKTLKLFVGVCLVMGIGNVSAQSDPTPDAWVDIAGNITSITDKDVKIGSTTQNRNFTLHGAMLIQRNDPNQVISYQGVTPNATKNWWLGATTWYKGGFQLYNESTLSMALFVDDTTGNIGIGTTRPLSKFEVYGPNVEMFVHNQNNSKGGLKAYSTQRIGVVTAGANDDLYLGYEAGNNTLIGVVKINNGTKKVAIGDNISMSKLENNDPYNLYVSRGIRTEQVKVDLLASWPDYVFDTENYHLKSLEEVESFINENKHLPEVPSEKEVAENGINLGEMDAILLKKIEELTLYVIALKKENAEIKNTISASSSK